ncbi:lanthionine synthetase LanC family protein [Shewanella seohaensis]|uniref:lanthionine synthetase LanC family protein n=1 Tax=Shewanella seohaensis TaxID=755175 RepID=UPI00200BA57D|nr:lanthionine synthetase LanC family protein [Shewanella seohaensis]MCL1121371.1 hypothetical protein [Shewanella seohaensis]
MQFKHPQQSILARQALCDITSALVENTEKSIEEQGVGLLTGLAGQQLYLWQLHKKFPELASQNEFSARMTIIDEQLPFLHSEPAFSYGLTGIAWLYEYFLHGENYQIEFNNNTDILLLQYLEQEHWDGELEFIRGLSGFSVYIARRKNAELGLPLARAILKNLKNHWHSFNDGMGAWEVSKNSFFRFNKTTSEPEFNLGLAHGVPSIIAALIPLLTHHELHNEISNLLEGSCRWLIQQQQASKKLDSCFSYITGHPCQSRLGWCYGDATIALTLLRTGKELNNNDFILAGESIALKSAVRRLESSQIQDTGICHGSAGLALIFEVITHYYNNTIISNAAQYWFEYTLEQYKTTGLDGFNAVREVDSTICTLPDYSLLGGYAGIGLMLLTAFTKETNWLDALLLKHN